MHPFQGSHPLLPCVMGPCREHEKVAGFHQLLEGIGFLVKLAKTLP
jgi:hypothetical protein